MSHTEKPDTNVSIQFLGAAETVTGSKFLIRTPEINIMVDCGMFQGIKKLRELNWKPLAADPAEIDVVLFTHAHLDHVGYLPRLVKNGFSGRVMSTEPTLAIARIIMEDSAKIQEEEAEEANRLGYSQHKPALPLYTVKDAEMACTMFDPQPIDCWIELSENVRFKMKTNGHVLGSVFIELNAFGKKIVFSGDVGRDEDILLHPPQRPMKADFLLLESTYGDRLHLSSPPQIEYHLKEVIETTLERNGTLIIPSFALERAQSLVFILAKMLREGSIPRLPIFLDSPMGSEISEVFAHQVDWHKLTSADVHEMFRAIHFVKHFSESIRIAEDKRSKIIIAGSGMVTGGRVLHYLKYYLGDERTTVLLVGYQAEGTRGRQLLEGASEVKIHGEYFKVAADIRSANSLSGHADQRELLNWVSGIEGSPEKVFLVHGELQGLDAMRVKLKDTFGWRTHIPELGEEIELY